jgi:hypothetical protein
VGAASLGEKIAFTVSLVNESELDSFELEYAPALVWVEEF